MDPLVKVNIFALFAIDPQGTRPSSKLAFAFAKEKIDNLDDLPTTTELAGPLRSLTWQNRMGAVLVLRLRASEGQELPDDIRHLVRQIADADKHDLVRNAAKHVIDLIPPFE